MMSTWYFVILLFAFFFVFFHIKERKAKLKTKIAGNLSVWAAGKEEERIQDGLTLRKKP